MLKEPEHYYDFGMDALVIDQEAALATAELSAFPAPKDMGAWRRTCCLD